MKKLISLIATAAIALAAFAQAPGLLSYQAVVRNTTGALVTSHAVGMQLSIVQGSPNGTAVYVETQTDTTNANGLASLAVGAGTPVTGTMAGINWANGPYYLVSQIDPTGGTNYTINGASQLLSVPYALYAAASGTKDTTPWAYAGNGTDIYNVNSGNVGIGTSTPAANLDIEADSLTQNNMSPWASAVNVRASSTQTSFNGPFSLYGIQSVLNTTLNGSAALRGLAYADSGQVYGVMGVSSSAQGAGVMGSTATVGGVCVEGLAGTIGVTAIKGISTNFGSSGTSNVAGFFQAANAGNNYAIIVPQGGGWVGIDTAAPSEALEVNGNVRLSNSAARNLYVPDAAGGVSGSDLTIQAGGTPWNGNAASGGNLNLTAGNMNTAGSGNDGGNVIITTGGNPWFGNSVQGGDIIFQRDSSYATDISTSIPLIELMRISGNTGNVGIGTSTPSVKLDIENGGNSPAFKLVDGTQQAGYVLTSDANGNASWQQASTKADYMQGLYGGSFVLPTGVDTPLNLSSGTYFQYDDNLPFNNGKFTITYSGVYHFDIAASVGYDYNNSSKVQIQTWRNGEPIDQQFSQNISMDLQLNAGDTVEFYVEQDSGGNVALSAFSRLNAHLVR